MLCDALARVIAVLLRRFLVAPVHGPARSNARLGQFGCSTFRSLVPGQIAQTFKLTLWNSETFRNATSGATAPCALPSQHKAGWGQKTIPKFDDLTTVANGLSPFLKYQ
jgi:hypothetical protein